MAIGLQPRGMISTAIFTAILGLGGGLLWIGRVRLGFTTSVVAVVCYLILFFDLFSLPPFLVAITEQSPWGFYAVFILISIAITLWLRPRSKPHVWLSRWWAVILILISVGAIPAAFIRTLFYEPFSIPARSMVPTLLPGDELFADKSVYGYGPYSFPLAHLVFQKRLWPEKLKRGDIVLFRVPEDPETTFIKRVVGLPGDTVQMIDGYVVLNGIRLSQEKMPDYLYNGTTEVARYRETLPSGRSYVILNLRDDGKLDNTREFEVPDNSFFVLGDNRDNSLDSRISVGMVPIDNLTGKAVWIYANSGGDLDRARQDLSEN